jgi:hypothetical protein
MRARAFLSVAIFALACGEDPTPPPAPAPEQGIPLGIPPQTIARARREARGLANLPANLRAQTLERGRSRGSPSFAELAGHTETHVDDRVSYAGRVGLVSPAGDRLWIMALQTRRAGDVWTDPLYVLSVVDPAIEAGARARIDGWVVGPRRIGRHTLPLIVAFYVEPDAD